MIRSEITIKKFGNLILWSILVSAVSCGYRTAENPKMTYAVSPKPTSTPTTSSLATLTERVDGDIIWSGQAGQSKIWWSTRNLYVQSGDKLQTLWDPLAQVGVKDFVTVNSDDGSGEPMPVPKCHYDRSFEVMSVVATLVSFKDSYLITCERGAHPEIATRFTTIDVAKSGEVLYAREPAMSMDVDPVNPGKIIKLNDYFSEDDILRALLADRVVQKALETVEATASPRTIAELVSLFKNNDYELGDSGYDLRPDFLTRFAFHHVEGTRVAVRIGLPPHYGANQAMHLQLGLLLPIPDSLKAPLDSADLRRDGFLMQASREVARGLETTFKFETGDALKRIY